MTLPARERKLRFRAKISANRNDPTLYPHLALQSTKSKTGKLDRRNIVYLTSLFRLRCKPAVPYEEIAQVLLNVCYESMKWLAKMVVDRVWNGTAGKKDFKRTDRVDLKVWLGEYAEHLFHQAGLSHSITYAEACGVSNETVASILTHHGVHGHTVIDDMEGWLQLRWKHSTDLTLRWKAGSTPEGGPCDLKRGRVEKQPPIGTGRPAPSSATSNAGRSVSSTNVERSPLSSDGGDSVPSVDVRNSPVSSDGGPPGTSERVKRSSLSAGAEVFIPHKGLRPCNAARTGVNTSTPPPSSDQRASSAYQAEQAI